MIFDLLGFLVCSATIFFAGKKLSYYADNISRVTNIGKAWIGLILMASITSLPELIVGISSTVVVGSADLVVGNIAGSCGFNLGILAMMDALVPKHRSLLSVASKNHVVAAGMGIILLAIAAAGMYLPQDIVVIPGIGVVSFLFIAVYLFSIWLIHRFDKRTISEAAAAGSPVEPVKEEEPTLGKRKTFLYFALFALIIIVAGVFLPTFTDGLATAIGLDQTLAGTFLLAIATSLPEIAISVTAVRMGAIDLCVGNLLGSNLFNIFILAISDFFYPGHLLKDASDTNMISFMATIMMSAIAIIGLSFQPATKRYILAWDALLIFVVYFLNMILLYQLNS